MNVAVVFATKVDFVKLKSVPAPLVVEPAAPKLYPATGPFHALNIVTALLYKSKAKSGFTSSLKVITFVII